MLERIKILKAEIERLRKIALSSNDSIGREIVILIRGMQDLVDSLEEDAKALTSKRD